MQFSRERSASLLGDEKVCQAVFENVFVPRRIEQLELPCRYSVVYELSRIDYMLNLPSASEGQSFLMSISA